MNWFKKIFCECNGNLPISNVKKRIYGYAIEFTTTQYEKRYWMEHYNHKIYRTKEIAQEAIDNSKWEGWEYRIITLYVS